jgi:hypothetical protein
MRSSINSILTAEDIDEGTRQSPTSSETKELNLMRYSVFQFQMVILTGTLELEDLFA